MHTDYRPHPYPFKEEISASDLNGYYLYQIKDIRLLNGYGFGSRVGESEDFNYGEDGREEEELNGDDREEEELNDDRRIEDLNSEGREDEELNAEDRREGPRDGGRFLYVNSDDEVTITRAGAALITPAFYEKTDPACKSWRDVPQSVKEFYFREFKKNARPDPAINEGKLRKAFLKKAAKRYSGYTYNVWDEDPEFQEVSKTKKKNMQKGREDGPALGTYCGGSIPFSENMNRLSKKKGAPVSLDEVIIHTKTKKHDGQSWVDPVVAELQAQFLELREEARKKGLKVTDEQIWYSLVEGHNAKNRVPGVGDYEHEMRKMNQSSKPRRSAKTSSSAMEIAALRAKNEKLQEEFDNLRSNLTLTIHEELKKLLGGNLPPRRNDEVPTKEGKLQKLGAASENLQRICQGNHSPSQNYCIN
ncbi:unnamed protein product [Cuscuta campestris]|uniref:Uncharacterized protein n=1 Tax=Cuscuta campestris TaxID=132261 RepID=A0A484M6H4_9ASTE|nr:unnamed protein product [Cuscuta campestris]